MEDLAVERRIMRKASWRILPFLFLLYVFSYLDRSNVGAAALQMNADLHFSPAVFGLGAGIFFVGYALFELPSNLILARVGARIWLARIMITWGAFAVAMMFVKSPSQFFSVRFLLGAAEAGFFPGVIFYLSSWFPKAYQARATAWFVIAIPLAQVVGGLLAGPLLSLRGAGGLAGWQWLFLLEGLPSVLLGITTLFYLTDRPREARWLLTTEREWLDRRLESEQNKLPDATGHILRGLGDPIIWLLTIPYFAYYTVGFGYVAWAPTLIKRALGASDNLTNLLAAGIALVSIGAYLLTAQYSDRYPRRCLFAFGGLAVSTAGCIAAAFVPTPGLQVVSLALIPIGSGVFLPTFWCLPRLRFDGASSAAPIALISAIGSAGGFFGPTLIGYAKQLTGADNGAYIALGIVGLLGCLVCWSLQRKRSFEPAQVSSEAAA